MMKNVLHVCRDYRSAVDHFNDLIKLYGDSVEVARKSQLTIERYGVCHRFVSVDDIECKVRGHSFDRVIIDEYVSLTELQDIALKSRVRVIES
jgi:hypothetical protein